jgi:hypothetical protein
MGSQSVEGSNALDRTSPIEKKGKTFVVPTIGLPSASDATTMGDFPTLTTTFSAVVTTLQAE